MQQEPQATAPRLYEDSLNDMIDQQTVRVAGLSNRVPTEVLLLEVLGAALAMFLLGLHVGVLGRSYLPVLLAAGLVALLAGLDLIAAANPDYDPRHALDLAAIVHGSAAGRGRPLTSAPVMPLAAW